MVTAPPPKPPPKTSRETWADWLPDVEPTLTIDDVIARLQERGVDDVSVDTIRLWQHRRVLPAPIRRQVGTGRGGTRAFYPPQAVDAIAEIRPLQQEGVRLRQINAYLARMFGLNRGPIDHPLQATITGSSKMTGDLTTTETNTRGVTSTRTVPQTADVSVDDPAFLEAMTEAARRQGQRVGAPINEVEVTFTDTRGRKHSRVYILNTDLDT